MGAWGYTALENDGALDWRGDFTDAVVKLIRKGLKSKWEDQQRAAAKTLILLHKHEILSPWKAEDDLELAAAKLKKILKDKQWLEGWKDPKAVQRDLRAQIRTLERLAEKVAKD